MNTFDCGSIGQFGFVLFSFRVITYNFVLEDGDIVTTHKIWIRSKLAKSGSSWTSKKV